MKYETYWSILDTPAISIRSYDVLFVILIVAIVGWIFIKKFWKCADNTEKQILLWSTGIVAIGSLFAFTYLIIFDKDAMYRNAEKMLESSNVAKVEGKIENFERGILASPRGVKYESFTVDSVDFFYTNALLGKFNQFAKVNNFILKDSLPVRITYGKTDKQILKLEIDKNYYSP